MRKKILGTLIFLFISAGNTWCQLPGADVQGSLEKLYKELNANHEDADRLRINDSIKTIVESYISSDNIFTNRLPVLKNLGQITSPDSLIKIVTWNLVLSSEPGKYFCYLIRKSPADGKNIIYNLTGTYEQKPILTDTVYSKADWYGALYYDIRPFFTDNRQTWVLLGINYSNPLVTRKIIDVLSFTPENNIIFGRKWFDSGDKISYRHVFEYSSTAVMSLRFVSDSTMVFDHLVPFLPSFDDHRYYGPDYSYDSYTFQNGLWELSINVDVRNKE